MSGDELAGRLAERIVIERRGGERDAIGGASGGWAAIGNAWAAIAPDGAGEAVAGEALAGLPRWRVTLRATIDAAIGDRLVWGARRLAVRGRGDDPALRDRFTLTCEEER